jgi:uncharacterized secreted protein with C-terminal beta-propeller domain
MNLFKKIFKKSNIVKEKIGGFDIDDSIKENFDNKYPEILPKEVDAPLEYVDRLEDLDSNKNLTETIPVVTKKTSTESENKPAKPSGKNTAKKTPAKKTPAKKTPPKKTPT